MHWITFTILVLATTVLQQSVAPFFAVHTIRPDLLVIVAIHYALAAKAHDALLACWCIGLVMDLTSLSFGAAPNVGLHAFSLGLIAWVVVKVRDLTFRESVMTQIFFTFFAKVALSLLTGFYAWHAARDSVSPRELAMIGIYDAVYTAVLAPYGHWLMRQLRNLLGIGGSHRVRMQ